MKDVIKPINMIIIISEKYMIVKFPRNKFVQILEFLVTTIHKTCFTTGSKRINAV